ncbi:addiction module protein [Roseibacillus persicicus]|uniref:addiction module protein n=1 Tax=Roseibacillus persicicus TaxID=454148 RepID=UPI00398B4E86
MKLVEQIEQDMLTLSVPERMRLLERLGELVPVPEGEEPDSVAEAKRRLAEMQADPSIAMSWEEIKTQLGRG